MDRTDEDNKISDLITLITQLNETLMVVKKIDEILPPLLVIFPPKSLISPNDIVNQRRPSLGKSDYRQAESACRRTHEANNGPQLKPLLP
jgi:hypothetical protein